jgi:hypothetical protein
MWSDKILRFYRQLSITAVLPDGVEVLNPYKNNEAFDYCSQFYSKFYNDDEPRRIIFGINPGRFGGGITGVPFTDPLKLEACGIQNSLPKKAELSADFIYKMIDAFGGAEKFYGQYFFSAMSPLGFIRDGKNLNYYDIRELQEAIEPFMIHCIRQQLDFSPNQQMAFCLGEGENFKYLAKLNARFHFFQEIIPLPHPRFIMQYRRKQVGEYISSYVAKLSIAI